MRQAARGMIKCLKDMLVMRITVHNAVADDIVFINLKRIIVLAAIAIPFNVAHIIIFWMGIAGADGLERTWRIGIIISHVLLAISMGVLGLLAYRFRKRATVTNSMRALQYAAVVAMLYFGVSITAVDQLVTTNITPFLVACTIISASMVIRPYYSLPVFAVAFAAFVISLGITQTEQSVLLTNRVNGLTSIGIALCLSFVLWNSTVANILQRRRIISQQKELEEKNRELQFLVYHDPMTNLYNRRKFEELLTVEIAMVRRYGRESSLVMLDIDGFKAINDKYGHPSGDRIVLHIASLLKSSVRETDSVARWGGDEFIVLLPCTSATDGMAAAEKLGSIIRQTPLPFGGELLNVTASFGVTAVSCDSENSLEQTYKDADLALYMAKGRGRDCVAAI